jgi:putative transposase
MRLKTRRQAMEEVIDWLVWYNSHRLHPTLCYMSPMHYEQHWLAAQPKTVSL